MVKKVLVLGGAGYIGSAVANHLMTFARVSRVDVGWYGIDSMTGYDSQVCDYRDLSKEYVGQFDVVFLAAAHSSVPMCNNDAAGAYRNNVVNVINFITDKLHPSQRLVYASSSCVYTKVGLETDALAPTDVLSATKTAVDHILGTSGLDYYALRFGSVNGVYTTGNFRSDLMINAMTTRALREGKLTVNNGQAWRPILSMRDLCRAVEKVVLFPGSRPGVYNVASFNLPICEVAKKVSRYTGSAVETAPDSKTFDFTIDTTKFRDAFEFEFMDTVGTIVEDIRAAYHGGRLEKAVPRNKAMQYV